MATWQTAARLVYASRRARAQWLRVRHLRARAGLHAGLRPAAAAAGEAVGGCCEDPRHVCSRPAVQGQHLPHVLVGGAVRQAPHLRKGVPGVWCSLGGRSL